jgi:Holliday junction resolvase-like predicted endonuclease
MRLFVGARGERGGMTTWTRNQIGALGEDLAVEHLRSLGLRVLDRNWRCRYGELDVIATDPTVGAVIFLPPRRQSEASGTSWERPTRDSLGLCR